MTIDEERLLLLKIKRDLRNFGILFDVFYKSIFNYIFRRVADYDVSRDIASETFLKAYININSFIWKKISISSWLYRIATNEINLYFRKTKNYPVSLDKLIENNMFDRPETDNYITEKELFEKELNLHNEFLEVQKNLTKLDFKYQEVLSLKYFEKKTIIEIADILNKKEGTIKSLLSRGINKLRDSLNNAT
jgi:RNA polymerase sigma-70 factor (ECF subfamily)